MVVPGLRLLHRRRHRDDAATALAYLYVHEVCIHERLPAAPAPPAGTCAWLRQMHRIHHLYGGEPYGMLLPVVPTELRGGPRLDGREPFARVASTA